jgi:nitrite reductase (NO-forming)
MNANNRRAFGHAWMLLLVLALGACTTLPSATERVTDAAKPGIKSLPLAVRHLDQPVVARPVDRDHPLTVKVELSAKSITALLADGVAFEYWTYNGTVPGPMIRVRQGDTVEISLRNSLRSPVTHSIDSHGVTGPGGGGKVTQTEPDGHTLFKFQALNPGVFVYHCATPMIPYHLSHGMYGLMVVEPPQGFPKVDREFYVMQGDFYLSGDPTSPGLHEAVIDKMTREQPDYVVFNGSVGALSKEHALKAKVGETVRIFFGNAGPNLVSSFHVIGEIMDRVYHEGASEYQSNVQSTLVPAGGATIVDFKLDVPGSYILVDHSLGRLQKGAAGFLEVDGPPNPAVFDPIVMGSPGGGGH